MAWLSSSGNQLTVQRHQLLRHKAKATFRHTLTRVKMAASSEYCSLWMRYRSLRKATSFYQSPRSKAAIQYWRGSSLQARGAPSRVLEPSAALVTQYARIAIFDMRGTLKTKENIEI